MLREFEDDIFMIKCKEHHPEGEPRYYHLPHFKIRRLLTKKRNLENGFQRAYKKPAPLFKPNRGKDLPQGRAKIVLSKPRRQTKSKIWMGKHHVQAETGYASDCIPLVWKILIVSDKDFRKNIDSDMLIDECNRIAMRTQNSIQVNQLCSNDGNFDISALISWANRIKANISFINGTRREEALIYGALDFFVGVIIVEKSHAYALLRNSDSKSE